MNLADLQKPFPADSIEWRVQQCGLDSQKNPYAKVVPYLTIRAIQERLDAVCGLAGWRNEFLSGPGGGVLCGISILTENGWIAKWDGADNTAIEPVKGGLSDAMKRAAVQWGIGRSIHDIPEGWAIIREKGIYKSQIPAKTGKWYHWDPPALLDVSAERRPADQPATFLSPENDPLFQGVSTAVRRNYERLHEELLKCNSPEELSAYKERNEASMKRLPKPLELRLREIGNDLWKQLPSAAEGA